MNSKNIASVSKFRKMETGKKIPPDLSALKSILHSTIHRSKISPKLISRELNISYQALVNGVANGDFKFSIRHALPLMLVTKDFSVLEFFARKTGHGIFCLPANTISEDKFFLEFLNLQDYLSEINKILRSYFSSRNPKEKNEFLRQLEEKLWRLICNLASIQNIVNRKILVKEKKGGENDY